ncbi:hypothetical protein PR048_002097 [Dryococelus australis]|uniref:Uncharacterized protein n=1 Tax=Dryococelus australis TaxID=614101 RepID=A0ABQ9IJZ6_9NEOP|nr:hypothetical protein PR048_002097 [Dryococelus australis]
MTHRALLTHLRVFCTEIVPQDLDFSNIPCPERVGVITASPPTHRDAEVRLMGRDRTGQPLNG